MSVFYHRLDLILTLFDHKKNNTYEIETPLLKNAAKPPVPPLMITYKTKIKQEKHYTNATV